MNGPRNKRRHVRKDVDFAVTAIMGDASERHGRCANLSVGGMYLTGVERCRVGTEVAVRFRLPTERSPMELPAVVRWTQKTGVGLSFGPLGAEQTYALTEFLAGNKPEVFSPRPKSSSSERRRHNRVELLAQVHARFAPEDLLLELQNISLSGALLLLGNVKRPPWVDVDRALELAITNPRTLENVVVFARVVRVQRDEQGLSFAVVFSDMDPVTQRGTEDLIQLGSKRPDGVVPRSSP